MMALPLQASNQKLARAPLKTGTKALPEMLLLAVFGLIIAGASTASAQEEQFGNPGHEREELGINQYTAPSIARVFDQLDKLKPLPFDRIKRELPSAAPVDREQKGLIFGGLIADGFLIVEAQRKNLVEEFGRVLLREARGLGVGERVTRHSASLTEEGQQGNWEAVREELIGTQADVEEAMIALRDEKMAHLISLGGWLRGLEMSAAAVAINFSSQRAQILAQPQLANYFADELNTLPPRLMHAQMFDRIRLAVQSIGAILNKKAASQLTIADIREIQSQAHAANEAIRHVE